MRIVPLLSVVAMFLSGPASSPAALVLDAQRGVATLEPYFTQITGRVDTNLGSFRLSDARYRRSLGKVPVSDPFGNGPWQTIEARDARGKIDLRLSLRADDRGHWIGKLWLANRSSKPLRLYSLVIEATRPGDWRGGRVNKLGAYESLHLNVELKAGESYGGVYATATNRPAFAGGFLTTEHYLGLVSVAPDKGGLRVTASNDAGGVTLPAGGQRESEPVWFSAGPKPSPELERWGDLAGRFNHVHIWSRNFATWCSWYSGLIRTQCENGNLEKVTLENLPIIAEKFRDLGLECTRAVDDSDGRLPGDWPLTTNALPSGYRAMSEAMKAARLWPGFWYDNNRVFPTSKLFQEHPDWVSTDERGKPYVLKGTGYGDFAFLDASVPAAAGKYRDEAAKFRQAGMRYCFADFTSEAMISPTRSHSPTLTPVEISRRAQVAVREGFGKDFYWLTQQTAASALGLANAMRTGIDSGGWNKLAYGAALSRWFMNRRVLLCDPDAWLPLVHTYQWDRDWGSWLALTGYAMTIGGDFRKLPPEREALIKRLLPPLTTTGRPRDLWERKTPAVIEQTLEAAGQRWKVVGLFNWTAIGRTARLNLDRLWDDSDYSIEGPPADPKTLGATDRRFLIYDFWPEKFLGETAGTAECTLPADGGRVLVCRVAEPRPQILAVGSHLGQGVEELKATAWDAGKHELTGTTAGRRGSVATTLRVRVPAGWTVAAVTAAGQSLPFDRPEPEVCRFTVDDRKAPVEWRVKFEGQAANVAASRRPKNPGLIADVQVDEEAAAKLRQQAPQLIAKLMGARSRRVLPAGYKLVHFARPNIVTGEEYDPRLGFGTLSDELYVGHGNLAPKHGLTQQYWYATPRVAYRVDGLNAQASYRLGVTLYADHGQDRRVAIAVVRASDGNEAVLADDVVVPSLADGQSPLLAWYDIPVAMTDPKGVILEVRRLKGPNATCAEFWLTQKTAGNRAD